MSDIDIRIAGRVGRITLDRPQALNALTHDMCRAIDAALIDWANRDDVAMLVIDGRGDKAFCAGGDIVKLYETGRAGNFEFARRFWRDEYAMNARLFNFPKPVATFLHGFTMGGGVGVGCHGSHRVVGETTKISMPECGIGLVPDVGGSLLLARAPGRLGEYLGTTGTRIGPGDAIHAGFADHFLPESEWPALIAGLERSGDPSLIGATAQSAPAAPLAAQQAEIDRHFAGNSRRDILKSLSGDDRDFAVTARKMLERGSPLSIDCTLALVRHVRGIDTIVAALTMEYRIASRAAEHGDFIEGIRAAIIDKDRNPRWRDASPQDVAAMLAPLGKDELKLGGST